MTFADQIANDYLDIDGLEEVNITPFDGSAPIVGVKALRRELKITEIQLLQSIGLVDGTLAWSFWRSELGDYMPQERDTFEDADGVMWTISAVDHVTMRTRYRVFARKNVG